MEQSNFDQLLERYITGQVSPEERAKIEAWLEVMKTENKDGLELEKEDEERLYQKIVSNMDNVAEIRRIIPPQRSFWSSGFFRVAAALLMLAFVAVVAYRFLDFSQGQVRLASTHRIKKLILNDGSIVWLHKDAELTYLEKTSQGIRYAELEGEGLFEVAKDPSHPFLIKCHGATIKVLGTSFGLQTERDRTILKVLTGKVNVSTIKFPEGIVVLPNEKLEIGSSGALKKVNMGPVEAEAIAAGTEYLMRFSDESLSNVLKRLETKFDVSFSGLNAEAGHCRITADLTDHSLDNSIQLISEILDVTFARSGNSIVVEGSGCK